MGMTKRKNEQNLLYLEPTGNEQIASGVLPIVDGSIGVDHKESPAAVEEKQIYLCGQCNNDIEIFVDRCPICNERIDWSSLDGN